MTPRERRKKKDSVVWLCGYGLYIGKPNRTASYPVNNYETLPVESNSDEGKPEYKGSTYKGDNNCHKGA